MKSRLQERCAYAMEVSQQVADVKALIIREAEKEKSLEDVQKRRARRGTEWRKRGYR